MKERSKFFSSAKSYYFFARYIYFCIFEIFLMIQLVKLKVNLLIARTIFIQKAHIYVLKLKKMVTTVICLIDEVINPLKIIVIQKAKSNKYYVVCNKNLPKMLQHDILTDRILKLGHYFLSRCYKSIHDNRSVS